MARLVLSPARFVAAALAFLVLASPVAAAGWSVGPLTSSGNGTAWMNSAAITDDGTVFVVYTDFGSGKGVSYLVRKGRGGSWQSPARLTNGGICNGTMPAIDARGSDVDVVWLAIDGKNCSTAKRGKLKYMHSSDEGDHFSTPQYLSTGTTEPGEPDVATGPNGEVLVGWTDDANGRMYVRSSTDGATFAPAKLLGTTTAMPYGGSSTLDGDIAVAIGDGVEYAVYLANQTTVQVKRSTSGGSSWRSATRLATNVDAYSQLTVTAEGNRADVAFAKTNAGHEWAAYRETINGGTSWKTAKDLTTSSQPFATYPAVALRDGTLRAIYSQCVTSACAALAVYYREQQPGQAWSSPVQVSNSGANDYSAGVAGVGSTMVVMFYTLDGSASDAYVALNGS